MHVAGGLYLCQGRCGARWLEEVPGQLVDVAALPYGVCGCCTPPHALVRAEEGAVCPGSGATYLLLPDGTVRRADDAPYGLCQCCAPAAPLTRRDGKLVCQARPDHVYQVDHRQGKTALFIGPPNPIATSEEVWQAIDSALQRNSARVTVNGLFDPD
jgi:hypothetical protein